MNIINKINMILSSNLKYTPLYHYTKLISAMNIIKTNEIYAPFGVRLTRNANLHLEPIQGFGGIQVRFEINKDKLAHNYKITPNKDTNYYIIHDDICDESEEIVNSNKINNINKYITKITLFKNIIKLEDSKLQILLHRFIRPTDIENDVTIEEIIKYFSRFNVEII